MGSGPRYRWVVLIVGTAAQAATAYFLGLAAVTPALREHFELGLSGVGVLIGLASAGLVPTLMAWGSAADRFGERWVMASGLVGAAGALGVLSLVDDAVVAGVLLVVAGASGASVNAASGRAVLTWFPATGRGTAMAIRQTSVPVGAAVAAVALPPIAAAGGVPAVFAALAATCLAAAVAVAAFIREPPDRPARSAQQAARARDVLTDRSLQRLSVAGLLLVVPQFLGSVFLVEVLHSGAGLSLAVAGALLGLTQVLGAIGRLANGAWSDRVRSRLGPLRIVAIAVATGFALAAVLRPGPAVLLAAVLVPAAALAISWNGLVFTAAGEMAPRGRAATAMAMSNTANYVSGAATPALGGLMADVAGWSAMLTMGAVAAIGAVLALRHLAEPAAESLPG
jgi:sugar phosphate permease